MQNDHKSKMVQSLLESEMGFEEEKYEQVRNRYSGFCEELFLRLEVHRPGFISKLRFFQPQNSQPEDVWAVYDEGAIQFGIQLEPNTPVIVLWDDSPENHIEVGDWSEDAYGDAIRIIGEVFFAAVPSKSLPLGWW